MSKKLQDNGLWDTSRMMLPQHRERSVELDNERKKLVRPALDEEEQQRILGYLKASKAKSIEVSVTVFGEFSHKTITGVVTGLDRHLVKIAYTGGWQLVNFNDVIGVYYDYACD